MLPRKLRFWFEPWDYDDYGRKRLGAWSQSYSGERYWIMDPLPEEVHLVDIVIGLSNAARYRGQTKFFYPVLQHSVLVSQASQALALKRGWTKDNAWTAGYQGLLHDAPEAFLGDVARPLKRMRAMKEYCRVEALWETAIYEKFKVLPTRESSALVHEVDHRIVLDEIQVVMKDPDMWARGGRYSDLEPLGVVVEEMTQMEVIDMFENRCKELLGR